MNTEIINCGNKKVFVFDWDGTIFDSMEVKRLTFTDSFFESVVFEQHNIPSKKYIYDAYVELSGIPRKEIFNKILQNLSIPFDKKIYDLFNLKLTNKNKEKLLQSSVFQDAFVFINKALKKDKIIFISSSVPQEELNFLVAKKLELNLLTNIQAIYGSSEVFQKGEGHFDTIIQLTQANKNEIIFFGDDYMDYVLSTKYGIDCILINRNGIIKNKIHTIRSFEEVSIG